MCLMWLQRGGFFPSIKEIYQMGVTFCLTVFAWIFFRAENLLHALYYIREIGVELYAFPDFIGMRKAFEIIIVIFLSVFMEFLNRKKTHSLDLSDINNIWIRRILYSSLIILMLIYVSTGQQEFIYFQCDYFL